MKSIVVLLLVTIAEISAIAGALVIESRHAALDMRVQVRTYGPAGLSRDTRVQIQFAGDTQRVSRTRPLINKL